MDNFSIDQNLNKRPFNPLISSASRLGGNEFDELGTGNDIIEERFHQLRAATLRAGLSMRRQQMPNSIEIGDSSIEPVMEGNGSRGTHGGNQNVGVREGIEQKGKGCKRESSRLVAMALEMETEVKKVHENGGNFYDCNICLSIAKEPILTCCGHLFCWACFCKLSFFDSNAKECPVCEGEVTESNIIPVYGNGESSGESKWESAMIPPRPKAQRVESARQQRVSRGVSHVPVAEALRRIRTSISAIGDTAQEDSSNNEINASATYPIWVREDNGLARLSQFTRAFSESAASLSSISSAINNAERLVEDLETFINDRQLQRSVAQLLSVDGGGSLSGSVTTSPLEHQISREEIVSALPVPSSLDTAETESMTTNTATERNPSP